MPRETKAQKSTRIGLLLADYDESSRALRKITKHVDELKAQIRDIDPGTYGDWVLSRGTPREILDQKALAVLLTENGMEAPKTVTQAPIVVTNRNASDR
jgi:hypothetical protein